MKQIVVWYRIVLIGVLLINNIALLGQTYPYPTGGTYVAGYIPTSVSSADVTSVYNNWASGTASSVPTNSVSSGPGYLTSCSGGQYSVSNGGGVYSEGIGYGLLITAYMGNKTAFDGLWAFYKANENSNGVMNWTGGSTCGTTSGNAATDADQDAAMALIIASQQWPTATSPYTYATEAKTLITAIKASEVATGCVSGSIPKPGDQFGGCNCTNASYFAPAYYRIWACFMNDNSWNVLADDVYVALNNVINTTNGNTTTGLVPAWQNAAGTSGAGGCPSGYSNATEYQYDACRVPWRIGLDYLWFGTPAAQTYLTTVANWVNGVGISNIGDGYNLNGTQASGYRNSAFIGPFCVSAMAVSQTMANSFTSWWITENPTPGSNKIDDSPYFQNTLRVLTMLTNAGYMWKPTLCGPVCAQPKLGPDVTTCGSSFPVTLNSGTSTATNVTFTWEIISPTSSTLVNASSTANTYSATAANGAGTYVVIRDSASCTKTDTIVISSTLPVPSLGSNQIICNPSSYDLSPSNLTSFPAGTTWQWQLNTGGGFNNITGSTSSTLSNARIAGTYKLLASISGCATTSSTVVLTSDLPKPIDGCNASAPIPLSVIGSDTYNWYSTATSTTVLATGNSYNAPAAGTYYVQDMSSTTGSVGPTAMLGGAETYGSTTSLVAFTASQNFTILSIQVPLGFSYLPPSGGSSVTVTVSIYNSTGSPLSPVENFTSNALTVPSGSSTGLYTFSFPNLNILSSWGPNLTMSVNTLTFTNGASGYIGWFMGSTYSYPYNSTPSGVVSITGAYDGGAKTNEYGSALNWQIQTGTPCSRIAVVATTSSCTLPVEWLNIQASRNSDDATSINWSTAQQSNNSYFVVQRSLDGLNFYTIDTVYGAGTTNSISNYSVTDLAAPLSALYYRIIQYDYNGQNSASQIVFVGAVAGINLVAMPNPFSDKAKVLVQGAEGITCEVTVTNIQGIVLQRIQVSSNNEIFIGDNLSSGIYFVSAYYGNSYKTIKVIKQ